MVLLTLYHSLASFTFGCGINPDIHTDGGHTFRPPSLSGYCVCDIANGNGGLEEMFGNQQVRQREMYSKKIFKFLLVFHPVVLKIDLWNAWSAMFKFLTIECTYTCDDLDSCTLVFRCPSCLVRWKCWWRRWSSSRNVMTKRKPVRRKWPLVLRGRRQRACWWSPRVSGFFLGLFQTMVQERLVLKQHVWSTEDEECVPSRDISRHFEDPSYGYKDFYRRGEQVPTLRVQVRRKPHCFACCRW